MIPKSIACWYICARLTMGNRCATRRYLGLCGDFDDEDNRYPFVLMPDGTLDFGTYLNRQPKRFWHFRWGDRIDVGEVAVITDKLIDYRYRITHTERL